RDNGLLWRMTTDEAVSVTVPASVKAEAKAIAAAYVAGLARRLFTRIAVCDSEVCFGLKISGVSKLNGSRLNTYQGDVSSTFATMRSSRCSSVSRPQVHNLPCTVALWASFIRLPPGPGTRLT